MIGASLKENHIHIAKICSIFTWLRELAREPPAAGHREYAGDATDVSKELAQDESCIFDVGAVTCFPQHYLIGDFKCKFDSNPILLRPNEYKNKKVSFFRLLSSCINCVWVQLNAEWPFADVWDTTGYDHTLSRFSPFKALGMKWHWVMAKLCLGPYDLPGAPVADAVHAGAVVAWGSREKIHGTRVVLFIERLGGWCRECELQPILYFLKLFDMYLGGKVTHYLIIDNSVFSTLSAGSLPASSYLMWCTAMPGQVSPAKWPVPPATWTGRTCKNCTLCIWLQPFAGIILCYRLIRCSFKYVMHSRKRKPYAFIFHHLSKFVNDDLSNDSILLGLLGCWWRSFSVN